MILSYSRISARNRWMGDNTWCCWHCIVKGSLPLHYDPIVWFRSQRQSTTNSGPSISVKTHNQSMLLAFKLFLGWMKSVAMLPFCIFMLQTTPVWFHLWRQACPLNVSSVTWEECGLPCGRLRGPVNFELTFFAHGPNPLHSNHALWSPGDYL